MKISNALLSAIVLLLAVNCYFSYKAALSYDEVSLPQLEKNYPQWRVTGCIAGTATCPRSWQLKGHG